MNTINNQIDATYSPEDNKLRLYCRYRLDDDEYKEVKAAGYSWAPKQELFVAHWSINAEDIALKYAGDIEAEQSTMIDRAEAKADRLEQISDNREKDFSTFMNAANNISERFAFGQPILIGHHSQRKAEKDKQRVDNNLAKAGKAQKMAGYWLQRAAGCQHHANRKNNDGVRLRRIKTLLADMRKLQRTISEFEKHLNVFNRLEKEKRSDLYITCAGYSYDFYDYAKQAEKGEITLDELLIKCKAKCLHVINSERYARRIVHILNRLGYERSFLYFGKIPVTDMRPALVQTFCREQGADKPKATQTGDMITVKSSVSLPAHLTTGNELTLSTEKWIELMQGAGFCPPVKMQSNRPKGPSLLNLKVKNLRGHQYGNVQEYDLVKLTKAEYKKIYSDHRGTALSECKTFKFRIAWQQKNGQNGGFSGYYAAVFLTDSKEHKSPLA